MHQSINSLATRGFLALVSLACCILLGTLYSHGEWSAPSILEGDAVSDQWSYMNNQPTSAGSAGAAEQQYMDNLALQAFRKEHETSLRAHVDSASTTANKPSSQRRKRRSHGDKGERYRYYEPSLPSSATQGWSDLLSRVTRELASDTFDIEEMKVSRSIVSHLPTSRSDRSFVSFAYSMHGCHPNRS